MFNIENVWFLQMHYIVGEIIRKDTIPLGHSILFPLWNTVCKKIFDNTYEFVDWITCLSVEVKANQGKVVARKVLDTPACTKQ